MRSTRTIVAVVTAAALALAVPAAIGQRPGARSQADLSATGRAPSAGIVGTTSVSGDGRYVAFDSDASDLVPGDTNGAADVFVKDMATGKIVLVSHGLGGTPGVGASACAVSQPCWGSVSRWLPSGQLNPSFGAWDPAISDNGRYVAFTSSDKNLVKGEANSAAGLLPLGSDVGLADIFVYDLKTATMTLVSVSSSGAQANGPSYFPSISADGRYVSFTSEATNLVAGDTNGFADVFVHDLKTRKTVRVSVSSSGGQACPGGTSGDLCRLGIAVPPGTPGLFPDQHYPQSSISGTGRYVAFSEDVCGLVTSDTNCTQGVSDVFVRDLDRSTTVRVSVASGGAEATDSGHRGGSTIAGLNSLPLYASGRSISDDGRYVVFSSDDGNLVPNEPQAASATGGQGIYVHDAKTDRTYRVDVQSDGETTQTYASNGTAPETVDAPTISRDGRFVSMYCVWCVPGAPAGEVLIYDRATGQADQVPDGLAPPRGGNSKAWNGAWSPAISSTGRWVAFTQYWTAASSSQSPEIRNPSDAILWDYGATRAAGGLTGPRLTLRGVPAFERARVVSVAAPRGVELDVSDVAAVRLLQATLAYRPEQRDLFGRIEVAGMPSYAAASPATVYGFDLSVRGVRYRVQVSKGLFGGRADVFREQLGSGYQWVATLPAGYGTTGSEVSLAIPLADIGAAKGGALSGVSAFSAVGVPGGATVVGATTTVDRITLSR